IHQVMDNLIGNAIKYSPNGEPVDVSVKREGDEIVVTISDRGIGVQDTELASLFSRFARGSNARRLGITGTGFGLYLAQPIAEKHGGSIAAESQEGKGSTFTVRLPAASADDGGDETRRVLLIDADGEARSFTAHALRDANYRLKVVRTLAEALPLVADERF